MWSLARLNDHVIVAYSDPAPAPWLGVPHIPSDEDLDRLDPDIGIALGLGGTTHVALDRRLHLLDSSRRLAPALVHPSAVVATAMPIGDGAQVMAGSIVQVEAVIGTGAIVNTGAIVEHGVVVGRGAHVAPGAIVLGDAQIGACGMIGAGAIVLPGAHVPDGGRVNAGTRWP